MALSAGTPAIYLTNKDLLVKRKEVENEQNSKEQAKAAAFAAKLEKRKQRDAKTGRKQKKAKGIPTNVKRGSVICILRARYKARTIALVVS